MKTALARSPAAVSKMIMAANAGKPTNTPSPSDKDPVECLRRFKEHSTQCIRNAYEVEHPIRRSNQSSALTTSLPEDVFSLLHSEATVLAGFLEEAGLISSKTGPALFTDGVLHVLRVLKHTQTRMRLFFLTTLEESCAAANDFFRMSESMELFLRGLSKFALFTGDDRVTAVLQEGNAIVTLFSQDAVFAAERTQVFIMRAVQKTSISSDFFSQAWEDDWTENDVAFSMVSIFEDNLTKVKRYLKNDYLYHKALVISAKAMACFYVRCLINKADSVTRRRRNRERMCLPGEKQPFRSHARALRRISDDIKVMKKFFQEKCQGNATMLRIIADDFCVLEVILECVGATDTASLESFIVVIHKRTGADPLVTRYFVGDLWMLTAHKRGRVYVHKTLEQLQPDLQMVTTRMQERHVKSDDEMAFVRLDEMLRVMYEDRAAQGMLPACWACLPKVENEGNEAVAKKIRKLTRKVVELKFVKGKPGMF